MTEAEKIMAEIADAKRELDERRKINAVYLYMRMTKDERSAHEIAYLKARRRMHSALQARRVLLDAKQ